MSLQPLEARTRDLLMQIINEFPKSDKLDPFPTSQDVESFEVHFRHMQEISGDLPIRPFIRLIAHQLKVIANLNFLFDHVPTFRRTIRYAIDQCNASIIQGCTLFEDELRPHPTSDEHPVAESEQEGLQTTQSHNLMDVSRLYTADPQVTASGDGTGASATVMTPGDITHVNLAGRSQSDREYLKLHLSDENSSDVLVHYRLCNADGTLKNAYSIPFAAMLGTYLIENEGGAATKLYDGLMRALNEFWQLIMIARARMPKEIPAIANDCYTGPIRQHHDYWYKVQTPSERSITLKVLDLEDAIEGWIVVYRDMEATVATRATVSEFRAMIGPQAIEIPPGSGSV